MVVVLAALGIGIGICGGHLLSKQRAPANSDDPFNNIDLADTQLIQQGAYIARTADCVACHTAPGGQDYAGGLAMETPLGAIYSTNITPDPKTGIGNYSFADFKRAVKHGVTPDNRPLYPAMPYPSYVIMPDEDIAAMYAYFMTEVEPVVHENGDSTIPWPMDMRWPMSWWQTLFAQDREFVADPALSEQENRGAYLVEGPGHCGACHTPRGLAYEEKSMAMTGHDIDNAFLSGAVIDGWRAKSLRSEARGLASWTQDDLEMFFKTGRNDVVAAFGAMGEVVEHSTRYMTNEDIRAMAAYLKQLPPAKDKIVTFEPKEDTTTAALKAGTDQSRGAILYVENCMVCHRADGQGIPRIFPALEGNSAVFAKHPQSTIQITLEGGKMPSNDVDVMDFAMPAFNYLSTDDIVEVLNFIRNGWTNQAPDVTAKEVDHIRDFLAGKSPDLVTAGAANE